jgi:hypothetical protein
MKNGTQFNTYYVKNLADSGRPMPVRAASRRRAAKIVAGRDTDTGWTFCVWTESEWRDEQAPTEYNSYDL